MDYANRLEQLEALTTDLYNKDFLLTWDKSTDELKAVMLIAETLKELHNSNVSAKVFDSGLAISLFRDNSTRTRFSFSFAANLLGLRNSGSGRRKITAGPWRNCSRNGQHDLFPVTGHRHS